MGGPCDDAAFRRAIAGTPRKNARTKAAPPDQNCQETPAGAQDRDGSPPAIWLVWPELLVSEVFFGSTRRIYVQQSAFDPHQRKCQRHLTDIAAIAAPLQTHDPDQRCRSTAA